MSSYTLRLLEDLGKLGVKPASVPMMPNQRLVSDENSPRVDVSSYKQLGGRLIYLGFTRPDTSYAVHHLAQFMDKPALLYRQAPCYILRYLKATP